MIQGDTKPFTEAESHFADAKFYMEKDMVPEALPKEIKSTGKATLKRQEWQAVPKKQEREVVPSSSENNDETAKPAITKKERDTLKRTGHTSLPIHPHVEKKEWSIPIRNRDKQS